MKIRSRNKSCELDDYETIITLSKIGRQAAEDIPDLKKIMKSAVIRIYLGKGDFTKSIGITVAMGCDNDCTAATVGSIVGATVGIDGISKHWYECFNNSVRTYMVNYPEFKIDDVVSRFVKLVRDRMSK